MGKIICMDMGLYQHSPSLQLLGKVIKEKTNVICCNQKMSSTVTPENHITLECLICHKVNEFDLDYQEIRQNNLPFTYTSASMILGDLKCVGVDKDDIVILGIDARNSWRKDYQLSYKSGRHKLLPEMYDEFEWMLKKFNEGSNFHLLKFLRTEYDDIASVCVRHFKDKNVVLLTSDSDLEQMVNFPNCKIFKPKCKRYWIPPKNYNAYEAIMKKINKEVSDGLKTAPEDEREFAKRELCVSLLTLPEHIEKPIIEALDNLPDKYVDITKLPYRTIQNRFMSIYDKKNVITWEKCVKYEERMKNKGKKTLKKK